MSRLSACARSGSALTAAERPRSPLACEARPVLTCTASGRSDGAVLSSPQPVGMRRQTSQTTQARGVSCCAGSLASDGRQGLVGFDAGVGMISFVDSDASSAAEAAKPALPDFSWWRDFKAKNSRLQRQLKSYGMSGLIAYGFCNTVYYTFAFLFFWLYVAKVPRGLGWAEVGAKFTEVMALTWAYSQVTKVGRAGAAVALAPVVDGGLLVLQCRLRLRSKSSTFWLVVGVLLSFAAVAIGSVMLIWS